MEEETNVLALKPWDYKGGSRKFHMSQEDVDKCMKENTLSEEQINFLNEAVAINKGCAKVEMRKYLESLGFDEKAIRVLGAWSNKVFVNSTPPPDANDEKGKVSKKKGGGNKVNKEKPEEKFIDKSLLMLQVKISENCHNTLHVMNILLKKDKPAIIEDAILLYYNTKKTELINATKENKMAQEILKLAQEKS